MQLTQAMLTSRGVATYQKLGMSILPPFLPLCLRPSLFPFFAPFLLLSPSILLQCDRLDVCQKKNTNASRRQEFFPVAGPCLWNSLPVALRDRDISLVQFKRDF